MKKEINTKEIDELLTRSIVNIYPSRDFVESRIKKGEKLTIYQGIDPTGPTLHIGHMIGINKLAQFQKQGHKIILLMGDFTATIGDPDKSSTRVPLTHKQVMQNLKNYKKQASRLLSFTGKNPAVVKFNSKWLSKMNFADVLSLASHMSVQQMLERDMFDKRMKEGKSIAVHEFMYPLMQGYDSVAMNVDGEIGGNDQTFNMLCGRNLMKDLKNKEKFVITMKLLEDNTGKKMGKTEGNMVSLEDTPNEMYGKIMSWTDGMIVSGFELCTNIPMNEVIEISKKLEDKNTNPRDYKMHLAREIIAMFFDEKKAKEAEQNFISTFSKSEIPEDLDTLKVKKNIKLIDTLSEHKIVSSRSDFRRLVDEGAITHMDTNTKISKHDSIVESGVYRIGKKRFVKFEIK